jgi:hypothetical protein
VEGVPLGVEDGFVDGVVDGVERGGLLGGGVGGLDGVPLGVVGGDVGGVDGVLDGGVVGGGVVGGGVDGPLPLPLSVTVAPLGSNRTCACHAEDGTVRWSTVISTVCWPPAGTTPDVALIVRNRASGVAVQATGAFPEFHRVTVASPGLFER